eukprot:736066-Rhodomonas_salina.4
MAIPHRYGTNAYPSKGCRTAPMKPLKTFQNPTSGPAVGRSGRGIEGRLIAARRLACRIER